ncbi:hypothetical protein FD722_01655 [Photobacterium damselae subsp. damselae]|uniref:F4 family fimbrial subunit n=1 Tax=Photobacterium damselae TaxID=38293 RepID=UPI0010FEA3CB|nr:hypothetical protein [Photobacterium damselae]MBA5684345.1 hypothetical protein [Photobacterium damselae subsp. damselae]NVH52796.1 hypothetical protein [Photobacterium damselae subsp. damselae]NVO81411.1 hypothetical protein [Photobacterium damselae subsp. damselae]TLS85382.1 hypothetical protein FD719_01400 [Photobacterium damselae subsp. damselae]TLS93506.1 hypothetical protein FD722_01655 [Photobacterium damselae subsp. damselae]
MKKTLLAVLVLPAMFVAGTANATFIESQNGFTGKLDFNGTVINKAPNWAWEIPDASVAKAKDWELELQQSNVVGSNNVWNLANRGSFIALHGYMVAANPTGAASLTPVVTLNGTTLVGGLNSVDLPVKGTVSGKAVADGILHMKVSTELGATGQVNGSLWHVSSNALAWETTSDALQALQGSAIAALKAKYPRAAWNESLGQTYAQAEEMLRASYTTDVSGQFAAEVGAFTLTFPTASIPDTWTASLPIVVTMK